MKLIKSHKSMNSVKPQQIRVTHEEHLVRAILSYCHLQMTLQLALLKNILIRWTS